jgi:hypothetical protein
LILIIFQIIFLWYQKDFIHLKEDLEEELCLMEELIFHM